MLVKIVVVREKLLNGVALELPLEAFTRSLLLNIAPCLEVFVEMLF